MANGEQTQHCHTHMHTQTKPGINLYIAKDLEEQFTLVPPLMGQSTEDLAGLEMISLKEVDMLFSEFEQQAVSEQDRVNSSRLRDILDGTVYSFGKLDQVDEGLVPCADDKAAVIAHDEQDNGGWDAALLMSLSGLDCP